MKKTISFTKMVGAGNDFLMIDAIKGVNYKKLATAMCSRNQGVGADGLLILEKSSKANHRMRIINSDGSEAEMCGNGARCMAAYIAQKKSSTKKQFTLETLAGIISAEILKDKIRVHLSDPKNCQVNIPLEINGQKITVSYIDTGVPHTVVYVDHLKNIDVNSIGQTIRWHEQFAPRGTNVNFAEQINANMVEVRTFERGVEAETKACGTGSVATAIVTYLKANPDIKIQKKASMNVLTASTEVLNVTFDFQDDFITNVWLTGGAKFIAKGEYYV